MSVQSSTTAFMAMMRQQVLELAVHHLFHGNPGISRNKLVLDHIMPALWDDQVHEIHVLIRVAYMDNGKQVVGIFRAKAEFTTKIIGDRPNWDMHLYSLSSSMISSLGIAIAKLDSPSIRLFLAGDMTGMAPTMRRIWLG